VHGAVGFTWLSDAHLFLRRAIALEAVVGPVASMCREIVDLAGTVAWPHPKIDLPSATETLRAEVRDFRDRFGAAAPEDRLAMLADSGFALPRLAPPWGRSAGPPEQIVIAEELEGVEGHTFDWITETIVAVGTDDQIERWVRPALVGDIVWCQLFSEPGAGSDAAGITTRGRRTEGGWSVSGQKVWTTQADVATHGLATVRTDPDQPKHRGISMLMIDMHAPGVTVRPLHDLAGVHRFNEVFLDDVFVPDDDVVGEVDDGWAVARAALGGERQSISKSAGPLSADARQLLGVADPLPDEHVLDVGRLLATNVALDAVGVRRGIRAMAGAPPGATGEISKLATAEHAQEVHRLALVLSGAEAAFTDGASRERFEQFMFSRQHTIGGGTAEISRNQIGERILGLPREPSLR
jgi:alkylation response protein AidB-like acyl-CoA dehydrogenase